MTDNTDLTRLAAHIKSIIAGRKKMQAMSDKDYSGMTQKAIQRLGAEKSWLGMAIDKAEREAHAAAVDCGLADPREAAHYGEIDYRPSPFHHYRHKPTLPRCVQERGQ
jgi:hypothetical protein